MHSQVLQPACKGLSVPIMAYGTRLCITEVWLLHMMLSHIFRWLAYQALRMLAQLQCGHTLTQYVVYTTITCITSCIITCSGSPQKMFYIRLVIKKLYIHSQAVTDVYLSDCIIGLVIHRLRAWYRNAPSRMVHRTVYRRDRQRCDQDVSRQ